MVRFDPGGTVTVIPGSISHGQGHETMYKIMLSDRLGHRRATTSASTHSDTDLAPDGGGTYASRTAVLGGSAATLAADKIIAKARKIAAHVMEAAEADIEFARRALPRRRHRPGGLACKEVAQAAYVPSRLPEGLETGLYETASFSPEIPNFPNGCHVCEVEIDPETGDDPSAALCRRRRCRHRDQPADTRGPDPWRRRCRASARPSPSISSTIRDRASSSPARSWITACRAPTRSVFFEMDENPVPTKTNPLGVKGAGEAGNVGALAAIMNAVVDALAPLGITHIDMPATPEKVWRAIRDAQRCLAEGSV